MRKFGFGIVGIIIVLVIYYFTTGSTQIIDEMKKQIDKEVSTLESHGFLIKERDISVSREQLVLSFDNPSLISPFLTAKGMSMSIEEVAQLKGMELGLDMHYLPDAYSAISIDIFPLALPTSIITNTQSKKDKKTIQVLNTLIEKKTFLIHLNMSKTTTGFKGNIKDINESIPLDKHLQLVLKSFAFNGHIENNKIDTMTQSLDTLKIILDKAITLRTDNIHSTYTSTGTTKYDNNISYNIENMYIQNLNQYSVNVKNIHATALSHLKDGLAFSTMSTVVKDIHIVDHKNAYKLHNISFLSNTENLNIKAYDKLQHMDTSNKSSLNKTMASVLIKGLKVEIPTLSVEEISIEDKKIKGFTLLGNAHLNKSIDANTLEKKPLLALSAISANMNISLSKELFSLIAKQPKAMLMLMLFQPIDKAGKKIYDLNITQGTVKINGTSLF